MPAQLIPLTNAPNQQFQQQLRVNGQQITLGLDIRFNSSAGFWVMDISDQFGSAFVSSVPLLTGAWPAANILEPYDYLQIGSAYVVNQNGASTDFPNDSDIGQFALIWDDNPGFGA